VAGLLAAGSRAMAAGDYWIHSSGSGDWFQSANWSSGNYPAVGDEVYISSNSIASVGGITAATANNLYINTGTVKVGAISNGTLNVAGQIAVGKDSAATLNLSYGTISANTINIYANGTYTDTSKGIINLTGDNAGWGLEDVTVLVHSTITGTNGLMEKGTGILVLVGTNTYSGGTTINSGTLQVGTNGTSGNLGEGNVINNGTLAFNRKDNNFVVTNQISGDGNVTQIGSGKTILTGDNIYTGGTTINNGTLQMGKGETTGSLGSGDITDNSELIYNLSADVVVSNQISGTGNFTQTGSNTVTFIADNTYSGTTTINTNSTLQLGKGGDSGTLGSGSVIDKGVLVINRSDSLTFSNQISGTGNLIQEGTGTTILTENNTYSGTTTISNGVLQVGNGGATGSLGTSNVYDYGTLVFNRSNSIVVNNTISGTGGVVQAGTGTNSILTLIATNNTYSGGTTISNGTIIAGNGYALGTGDVTVEKDGMLEAGATLATNKTIIQVGGNYTNYGTMTFDVAGAISNTKTNEYDQIKVAGTATFDGTKFILIQDNYLPQHLDELKLVDASNVVVLSAINYKDSLTNWVYSPLLNPTLANNLTNVILEWEQQSFLTFLQASNVTLTRNQKAVAKALDSIANSTATNDIHLINTLDYYYSTNSSELTNNLPAAFSQISPDQLTSMQVAAFANMDSEGNRFLKRANELRADYRAMYSAAWRRYAVSTNAFDTFVDKPWDMYWELPVNFVSLKGDQNAAGYDITSVGVTVGADRRVTDHLYLGGAVGYAGSSASLDNGGSMDMDTVNLQLYAAWFDKGLHFEGMIGGDFDSYKTKREILGDTASGDTTGIGWTGLLGGGYDWEQGPWKFGPQLAVQYMSVNVNEFTESGSLAPLRISSQTPDAMHSQVGMDVSYRYLKGRWTYITPSASLAWRHDFQYTQPSLDAKFASGAGDSFTVYGPELGKDSVVASAGLSIQWKPSFNTFINLTAQMGRTGYNAENLNLGMRYSF
jgi:outer membrane autotransporter protein